MMHTVVQADLVASGALFFAGEVAARGESLISWWVWMREAWAAAAVPVSSVMICVKSKGLVRSAAAKRSGGRAWEGWRRWRDMVTSCSYYQWVWEERREWMWKSEHDNKCECDWDFMGMANKLVWLDTQIQFYSRDLIFWCL